MYNSSCYPDTKTRPIVIEKTIDHFSGLHMWFMWITFTGHDLVGVEQYRV